MKPSYFIMFSENSVDPGHQRQEEEEALGKITGMQGKNMSFSEVTKMLSKSFFFVALSVTRFLKKS